MGYLILEILILLALAVAIGLWMGWMIRGLHFKQRIAELQNEWAARFRSTEQEKDLASEKAHTLEQHALALDIQLRETSELIKQLEQERSAAQETIDNDIAQIRQLSVKIEFLDEELQKRDNKLKKFAVLLKTLQKLEREQKARLKSSTGTIRELISKSQEKSSEVNNLQKELEELAISQSQAQNMSKEAKDKFYELESKLRDREIQLELVRDKLEKQQQNSNVLEKELSIIQNHVTTAPANDISTQTHKSKHPVWILEKPDGEPDDFQKIKGIGPVMQRLLNEVGVFHYHQLARMNESDVLWIAESIKTFPKRIKRDRWQQQAVELDLDRMENETIKPKRRNTSAKT